MPEAQHPEERPCLHCMMVELIEDFFAENPAMSGESDKIDTGLKSRRNRDVGWFHRRT